MQHANQVQCAKLSDTLSDSSHPMSNFWPSCGFELLARDAQGGLAPTDPYLRLLLARPELALVSESCIAETALHKALQAAPMRAITNLELKQLRDTDARLNYSHFLAFRDGLLAAGTLQACGDVFKMN